MLLIKAFQKARMTPTSKIVGYWIDILFFTFSFAVFVADVTWGCGPGIPFAAYLSQLDNFLLALTACYHYAQWSSTSNSDSQIAHILPVASLTVLLTSSFIPPNAYNVAASYLIFLTLAKKILQPVFYFSTTTSRAGTSCSISSVQASCSR